MKGDFTRSTFRPRKHYSSVRMQQGRVQMDADWNEELDILAHLDETTRLDVIGACGAPEGAAGFKIIPLPDGDLLIGAGRIYVDGILCELERGAEITATPVVVKGSAGRNRSKEMIGQDIHFTDFKVKVAQLTLDREAFAAPVLGEDGRRLPRARRQWLQVSDNRGHRLIAFVIEVDEAAATLTLRGLRAPGELLQARQLRLRRITSYRAQPDYPLASGLAAALFPLHSPTGRLEAGLDATETSASSDYAAPQSAPHTSGSTASGGATDGQGGANSDIIQVVPAIRLTPGAAQNQGWEKRGAYIVYLDVWQRHLTALDDNRLREVALGGPDTATRTKTVWQVKLLPVHREIDPKPRHTAAAQPGKTSGVLLSSANLTHDLAAAADTAGATPTTSATDRYATRSLDISGLVANSEATAAATSNQATTAPSDNPPVSVQSVTAPSDNPPVVVQSAIAPASNLGVLRPAPPLLPGCGEEYPQWDRLVAGSSGCLSARTNPQPPSPDPCVIPPTAGYRRLENQLYRVEIHHGGKMGKDAVTFKWSRENGSVVTRWLEPDAGSGSNQLTVSSIGRDVPLGFAPDQWVELTDDTHDLLGLPGTLVRLTNAEGSYLTFDPATAHGSLHRDHFPTNPQVRRWEMGKDTSDGAMVVEVPSANDGWIGLEDGVEVMFEPGSYRTGDYWLIPARTVTGDVEWPHDDSGPLPQPAAGIKHHYCRLALIRFTDGRPVIEDCRNIFPPLTGAAGIHILAVELGKLERQQKAQASPQGGGNTTTQAQDFSTLAAEPLLGRLVAGMISGSRSSARNKRSASASPATPEVESAAYRWTGLDLQALQGSLVPNAGFIPFDAIALGLNIICDRKLNPATIDRPTCYLTLDLPLALPSQLLARTKNQGVRRYQTQLGIGSLTLGYTSFTLDASLAVVGREIQWRLTPGGEFACVELLGLLHELEYYEPLLARLHIEGNFIWAKDNRNLYLAGEALGLPAGRNGNNLKLPSGDGRRGGNFEMFFWLGEIRHLVLLPFAKSRMVDAMQGGDLATALNQVMDRTTLTPTLPPGFAAETGLTPDQTKAKQLIEQMGLADQPVALRTIDRYQATANALLVMLKSVGLAATMSSAPTLGGVLGQQDSDLLLIDQPTAALLEQQQSDVFGSGEIVI